jgi:ABC-type ATPase involved in cell division
MTPPDFSTLDPKKNILIKGAQLHNLKNLDVAIPRNKLVVITGLSGSGKSSLAFDTLYAEGQRRYVESLSSYARQFLGRLDKPKVEYIKGIAPAIAIEQKVFDQLANYDMVLTAPLLLITNGIQHFCFKKSVADKKYLFLQEIPDYTDKI